MFAVLSCSDQPSNRLEVGSEARTADQVRSDLPRLDHAAPDLGRTARCFKLVGEYQALLKQAKACTLQGGQLQCQKLVDSWVGCGCMTSVEASHDQLLAEMALIASEWIALGCQATCPNIPCGVSQPQGQCVDGSGGPRCEDQLS